MLVASLLGPYLIGVVGNSSFAIFQWAEPSRWILGIIAFIAFMCVFSDVDLEDKSKKIID